MAQVVMYYIGMDSSIAFWINPVILAGIGTVLWRSQVRRFEQVDKRFDRLDRQFREVNREVVANGKSIARIHGRHEGHLHATVPPSDP